MSEPQSKVARLTTLKLRKVDNAMDLSLSAKNSARYEIVPPAADSSSQAVTQNPSQPRPSEGTDDKTEVVTDPLDPATNILPPKKRPQPPQEVDIVEEIFSMSPLDEDNDDLSSTVSAPLSEDEYVPRPDYVRFFATPQEVEAAMNGPDLGDIPETRESQDEKENSPRRVQTLKNAFLKDLIRGQKPISIRFQFPNIVARLMMVSFLLLTPEAISSNPRGPESVPNLWHEVLMDIRRKRMQNSTRITILEKRLEKKYGQFLYVHRMAQLEEFLATQRSRVQEQEKLSEIFFHIGLIRKSLNYCRQCGVLHKHGPILCCSLSTHGPKVANTLFSCQYWKEDLRAAVIGGPDLYYLPIEQKVTIVNLGGSPDSDYFVPHTLENLDLSMDVSLSAHAILLEKLSALGFDNTIPVFIEFFRSTRCRELQLYLHVIGFANLLRSLQSHYAGPLIMTIGPRRYIPGEGMDSYRERKRQLRILQNLARLVGLCMGVPVAIMPIQATTVPNTDEHVIEGFWRDEHLFSSAGHATREFYWRIAVYLDYAIHFINKCDDQ